MDDSDYSDDESSDDYSPDENDEFTVGYETFMYIVGKTNQGKSTFIKDMLLNHRITPLPDNIFIQLGVDDVGDNKSIKLSVYLQALPLLRNDDKTPKYDARNVFVISSIDDGKKKIDELWEKVKKDRGLKELPEILRPNILWIADDTAASGVKSELVQFVSTGVHHKNVLLIASVQNPFTRDSKHIRGNASVFVVFGGHPLRTLMQFFSNELSEDAKSAILNMLTKESQASLEAKGEFNHRTPAIVVKDPRHAPNSVYIYRGLFDSEPIVIDQIDSEEVNKLKKSSSTANDQAVDRLLY